MLKNREVNFVRSKLSAGAVIVAGMAVLLSASPAWAHHAFAAEFHSWIHVDVKQADGTVVNWAIEAGSPNILLRRGNTKNTVKQGDKIVIEGYQSKDGSHRANGRDLTLPNGQHLFLGSSGGEGAPYEVPRPGVDVK